MVCHGRIRFPLTILRLESLNLSSLPLSTVSPPPLVDPTAPITTTTHLILLNTALSRWTDIDALELWTGSRLQSLRISLLDAREDDPAFVDATQMSGKSSLDRPILIAKLPGLESLNLTPIIPSERRDAELFYISHVAKLLVHHPEMRSSEWGRYEYLCSAHGRPVLASTEPRSSALRSKMISKHTGHRSVELIGDSRACIPCTAYTC